jgi:hypothetical protein
MWHREANVVRAVYVRELRGPSAAAPSPARGSVMEASAARSAPAAVRVTNAKPYGHGRNPDTTHAGPAPARS